VSTFISVYGVNRKCKSFVKSSCMIFSKPFHVVYASCLCCIIRMK